MPNCKGLRSAVNVDSIFTVKFQKTKTLNRDASPIPRGQTVRSDRAHSTIKK